MKNFKSKIIIAVILLMGITVFVGCEKESNLSQITIEKDETIEKSVINYEINPSNPLNEFDYIGQEHNIKLVNFIDSVIDHTTLEEHFVYNYFYIDGVPTEENIVNIIKQSSYNPDEYSGFMLEMYNENVSIFSHYLMVVSIINNSDSISSKVNSIISYENSIDYTGYTNEENLALKSMFSVARYSTVLWATEDQGGLGYLKANEPNYIGGSKKTHDIVMADISSTYIGALFTANPLVALGGGILGSAWQWGYGG